MNTADILDKAADLIEQRGWHQGYYVNECGGLCATGAIYAALGCHPAADPNASQSEWLGYSEFDLDEWVAAVTAVNRAVSGHDAISIVAYNDRPGRTKEEVVSTLRAAAQAARAEQ